MIAIIGIRCRDYTHYTSYRSRLPIYRVAIIRLLSFLFLDNFEGNANTSVAIKSSFTVYIKGMCWDFVPLVLRLYEVSLT